MVTRPTNEDKIMKDIFAVLMMVLVVIGALWGMSWGYQYYKVFSAEQSGKAQYAQAEQNRRIAILEAEAYNESATSQALAKIKIAEAEATAEVARARGVAEANTIIGDSLRGNTEYLHYLYVSGLAGHENQVIYVPTEAGLPLLEAGHRQ